VAHYEAAIRLVVCAHQKAADGSDASRSQRARQLLQGTRGGDGVGIEKQEDLASGRLCAAICSRSKAEIVRILDETRGRVG
jgi:hypothetical protein